MKNLIAYMLFKCQVFIIFENIFQSLCSKDIGSKTLKHAFSFKHVNIRAESNNISHVFRLRACLA